MICPVCNQNIPDGSNYCPSCAADLTKYRRQALASAQQQQAKRPQDPRMMRQQQTGQYQPYPPQQHGGGGGDGGIFEGITPRGKLFFGVGGLVLLAVLILLIVQLFGGGGGDGNDNPSPPTITTEPTSSLPDYRDLFGTPVPQEEDPLDFDLSVPATPTPTVVPVFNLLKKGSSGPEVTRLQERLKLLGFLPETELVDGQYGQATVTAVREFQRQMGLQTDGAAGVETQTKLFSYPVDIQQDQQNTQPTGDTVSQPG